MRARCSLLTCLLIKNGPPALLLPDQLLFARRSLCDIENRAPCLRSVPNWVERRNTPAGKITVWLPPEAWRHEGRGRTEGLFGVAATGPQPSQSSERRRSALGVAAKHRHSPASGIQGIDVRMRGPKPVSVPSPGSDDYARLAVTSPHPPPPPLSHEKALPLAGTPGSRARRAPPRPVRNPPSQLRRGNAVWRREMGVGLAAATAPRAAGLLAGGHGSCSLS